MIFDDFYFYLKANNQLTLYKLTLVHCHNQGCQHREINLMEQKY